jgi:hypothetical protein
MKTIYVSQISTLQIAQLTREFKTDMMDLLFPIKLSSQTLVRSLDLRTL